jgi:diacylglycerol kinase
MESKEAAFQLQTCCTLCAAAAASLLLQKVISDVLLLPASMHLMLMSRDKNTFSH